MKRVLKELIEYNGIDTCAYQKLINFKQFNIDSIISIPIEKPDIDQILKVWISYDIQDYEIIKTPKGCSCEGQILTGNKVYLSGDLKIKIEYVADKCGNSVHSMNFKLPFCSYITLQKSYNECSTICPSLYIEDVYCEQVDSRELYLNITLMSVIDIC